MMMTMMILYIVPRPQCDSAWLFINIMMMVDGDNNDGDDDDDGIVNRPQTIM